MRHPLTFTFGDGEEELMPVLSERKLYLAVLSRALQDLMSRNIEERADAIRWFLSENDEDREFAPRISFTEVVNVFKFSASRMRVLEAIIHNPEGYDKDNWNRHFRIRRRVPSS